MDAGFNMSILGIHVGNSPSPVTRNQIHIEEEIFPSEAKKK